MKRNITFGHYVVPLWLVVALLLSGILLGVVGDNIWRMMTKPTEVNVVLERISSGKIAYDTFSAQGGTATDIPWTTIEDFELNMHGDWTVESGMFKSVSSSGTVAVAYPTGVILKDFTWEARVRPMHLVQEGPEIDIGDLPVKMCRLEAVFDFYSVGSVLRTMISEGPPPPSTHSTYQTSSFLMIEGAWYTMKVILSGSSMKCYIDDVLKFDTVDQNLQTVSNKVLRHQGFYDGEWGYWDDVKIWKSNVISITNMEPGQKVELYDVNGNIKTSDSVQIGETKAVLDVSALSFPFEGYLKVFARDGNTPLVTTPLYSDMWGGDEYSVLNANT